VVSQQAGKLVPLTPTGPPRAPHRYSTNTQYRISHTSPQSTHTRSARATKEHEHRKKKSRYPQPHRAPAPATPKAHDHMRRRETHPRARRTTKAYAAGYVRPRTVREKRSEKPPCSYKQPIPYIT
jgi:hypothetical protein